MEHGRGPGGKGGGGAGKTTRLIRNREVGRGAGSSKPGHLCHAHGLAVCSHASEEGGGACPCLRGGRAAQMPEKEERMRCTVMPAAFSVPYAGYLSSAALLVHATSPSARRAVVPSSGLDGGLQEGEGRAAVAFRVREHS